MGFPRPIEYLSDSSIPELLDISMDLSLQVPAETLKACEFEVFKLAVGFYVGILQRAMAKNWLPQTLNLIKAYINKSEQCAYWVIEEFSNEQLIEENLIQNQQKEMRKFITGIIYCAMLKVYPLEKDQLNLYWRPVNPQLCRLSNLILVFIKNMFDLKAFILTNAQYF